MGTFERLDTTVIGDTVNTAARLESLNKIFGTEIILSDSVYQKILNKKYIRELGNEPLRGKKTSIVFYEYFGCYSKEKAT